MEAAELRVLVAAGYFVQAADSFAVAVEPKAPLDSPYEVGEVVALEVNVECYHNHMGS